MITILSATNRPISNARIISEIYCDLLQQRGEQARILDLMDLPADFITSALYKNTGKNPAFNQLVQTVESSDKIVFVVPEYNGSFPGVLKAFLDGLNYPESLQHKKAALVGISTGTQGGALALSHLTDVLNYMGMHVLAAKPRLMHIHKHLHDRKLTNPLYLELIRQQIDQLILF
jgi:chromate reductase